ncbi:baseplate wedge subunit [Serratia phage 92A1]|nr:baseplate wedge subunit [Serratia phage 92A1]
MNNTSVIYRSVITSKFRTEKMLNFYTLVGDKENENTIYTTFGRSESWGPNEKDPGFAPPYPSDDTEGVADMWAHMMGIVKVQRTYMDAVIPRRDWGDERYPNPRTFHIGDIVVTNNSPINQTNVGVGWLVYKVVDVPDVGACSISSITNKVECIKLGGEWTPGKESTIVPKRQADGENPETDDMNINMQDGYIWEYLYTIPPDVSINRCSNEHIVVPMPDELASDPARWGFENNISWYPNDMELVYRLKVNSLRFRAYMDSIYFPEASLPGNEGFRQISIIVNPLEKKKSPSAPNVKATKPYYNLSGLERHSGEMIYMENRQPIIRSMDQTEEINIIFEF